MLTTRVLSIEMDAMTADMCICFSGWSRNGSPIGAYPRKSVTCTVSFLELKVADFLRLVPQPPPILWDFDPNEAQTWKRQ